MLLILVVIYLTDNHLEKVGRLFGLGAGQGNGTRRGRFHGLGLDDKRAV